MNSYETSYLGLSDVIVGEMWMRYERARLIKVDFMSGTDGWMMVLHAWLFISISSRQLYTP